MLGTKLVKATLAAAKKIGGAVRTVHCHETSAAGTGCTYAQNGFFEATSFEKLLKYYRNFPKSRSSPTPPKSHCNAGMLVSQKREMDLSPCGSLLI